MPLTENMISNTAYRPGDVFTAYNGMTVEVGNTDAEGRLILADALAYTVNKLKPAHIIDIATLTGACVVTFGETVAGLISTDDALTGRIRKAADSTGEKLWPLPLYSEYEENMKSDIADLCNMSSEKNSGTIHGAAFLKNFVGETPWAHIDIAGTAWYTKQRGYRPRNATAYGLRLITDLLKNWDSYNEK
jgi:leucyl aminopeptidase